MIHKPPVIQVYGYTGDGVANFDNWGEAVNLLFTAERPDTPAPAGGIPIRAHYVRAFVDACRGTIDEFIGFPLVAPPPEEVYALMGPFC